MAKLIVILGITGTQAREPNFFLTTPKLTAEQLIVYLIGRFNRFNVPQEARMDHPGHNPRSKQTLRTSACAQEIEIHWLLDCRLQGR